MKIATLTIDDYSNQGNILQRYALIEVLKTYADEVDSLWIDSNKNIEYIWEKNGIWLNNSVKQLIKFIINRRDFRRNIIFGNNHKIIYRDSLIKSFCDRFIPMRYYTNFEHIDKEYDYFVVGSDQVWNPCQGLDIAKLMLDFASLEKRVSYAASISIPEIPLDRQEEFVKGINGMHRISVREKEGADLIKKLTGRNDVSVVVDPTLLISAEHWRSIARKPSWLKETDNIFLTYFLGPYSKKNINKIASENHLKVIDMFGMNNFDATVVSPEEWLYLIDHARVLYTDSFHGALFSILFKTPFVVMERRGNLKMTSRIDTLLKIFDFDDRRGNEENDYLSENALFCEFEHVDGMLEKQKKISHNYLLYSLKR